MAPAGAIYQHDTTHYNTHTHQDITLQPAGLDDELILQCNTPYQQQHQHHSPCTRLNKYHRQHYDNYSHHIIIIIIIITKSPNNSVSRIARLSCNRLQIWRHLLGEARDLHSRRQRPSLVPARRQGEVAAGNHHGLHGPARISDLITVLEGS